MRDRHLDQLLHMDDKEDIPSVIKIAFEPVGGLVVGSCVSSASASEKVPVFNRNSMLVDVIPGIDGIAVLETLQEPSKTLDILFCFNTPKVQSHEIEGPKATDGR